MSGALTLDALRNIAAWATKSALPQGDGEVAALIHPDCWRALRDAEARWDWYEHYRECRMMGKREIALETFWDGLP